MSEELNKLRGEILRLTREYSQRAHGRFNPTQVDTPDHFQPGVSSVPYAGRVFGAEDVEAAVGSALDFWLTLGENGREFEKALARFLGVRKSTVVNSGSSANLLAVSALTSHKLPDDRRIKVGDEVITCAAGFPTTVAPIIQNGAVPVFIDNDPVTGNACVEQLELAYAPGKTKAVMFAHALGNPFNIGIVLEFCRAHNLWLIEDNCDALGSQYSVAPGHVLNTGSERLVKSTGSWGDLSTQSFYPPHHITMGEGGAVNTVSAIALQSLIESFRDWGRDCWCESGMDNTCGKRFQWQLGELPQGFDHKYIYTHLGYNLKPLDLQAAIGRVQLERASQFVEARKRNWEYLRRGLADLEEFFSFSLPTHATSWTPSGFTWDSSGCQSECSWFGFLMLVRSGMPFTHTDLARHLDQKHIGNRMFFGGNLVRQPAFVALRRERPEAFRIAAPLHGADAIMNQALFLGTYPGLSKNMLDYMIEVVHEFVRSRQ